MKKIGVFLILAPLILGFTSMDHDTIYIWFASESDRDRAKIIVVEVLQAAGYELGPSYAVDGQGQGAIVTQLQHTRSRFSETYALEDNGLFLGFTQLRGGMCASIGYVEGSNPVLQKITGRLSREVGNFELTHGPDER